MDIAFGIAQYLGAITVLVLILGFVGLALLLLSYGTKTLDSTPLVLLSPTVGLASLVLITLFAAQLMSGLPRTVIGVTVLVSLAIVSTALVQSPRRETLMNRVAHVKNLIAYLSMASVAGLVPYIQLLISGRFPTGFFTTPTWTNNDLGAYLQMSTNLMNAGPSDANLIRGWNPAPQSAFDHPGVLSLLGGVSRLFGAQPFQVGMILISAICALLVLATIGIMQVMNPSVLKRTEALLAMVVVVNPPMVSAVSNYFLAQVVTLALVTGILGLSVVTPSKVRLIRIAPAAGLCFAAAITTSVETALSLGTVVGLLGLSLVTPWKNRRPIQLLGIFVASIGLLYVIRPELVTEQLRVFNRVSTSGVAGWPADFTSITALVGLAPLHLGPKPTSGVRLLDFALLLTFCVLSFRLAKRDRLIIRPLFALSVIVGMIVVGVLRWGPDGYQTWKFTTSAFSIVLVLVLVVAIGRSQILTLLLTAILGATISWSAYVWKDSQETAWVNPDLVSLTKEATALELKGVNILLSPFFETMAASVIAGRQAHMASPSYQFPSGQPLHYQCTITTKTRLGELPAGNDIIREHGNYVLAGSTRCLDPHKTTDP